MGFFRSPLLENDFLTAKTFAESMYAVLPSTRFAGTLDFKPRATIGEPYITIDAGRAWAGGVGIFNDSELVVGLGNHKNATVAVVIRIEWTEGEETMYTATVDLGFNPHPPIRDASAIDGNWINHVPGVRYDAIVAVVDMDGDGCVSRLTDARLVGSGVPQGFSTRSDLANVQDLDVGNLAVIDGRLMQYTINRSWSLYTPANTPTLLEHTEHDVVTPGAKAARIWYDGPWVNISARELGLTVDPWDVKLDFIPDTIHSYHDAVYAGVAQCNGYNYPITATKYSDGWELQVLNRAYILDQISQGKTWDLNLNMRLDGGV